MSERTFERFMGEVEGLLNGTAAGKGYNRTGADGPNDLYEFIADMNGNAGHAAGEIVYKIRRYMAKGNPEDLAKIGAWAYLAWKHHQ